MKWSGSPCKARIHLFSILENSHYVWVNSNHSLEIICIFPFEKGISNTFLTLLLLRYHTMLKLRTQSVIFLLLCSLNVACGLSFKAYFLLV